MDELFEKFQKAMQPSEYELEMRRLIANVIEHCNKAKDSELSYIDAIHKLTKAAFDNAGRKAAEEFFKNNPM